MSTSSTYPWKHGAPRTVFLTGASSGIGRQALRLARVVGDRIAARALPHRPKAQP